MLGGLLTGLWLTAASSVGYEAHARVLTRARAATGAELLQGASASDVELLPTLVLKYKEQNLEGRVLYAPRLTLREALGDSRTQVVQGVRFQGEWRVQRGLRLFAEEHATYGTVDLFTQGGGVVPGSGVDVDPNGGGTSGGDTSGDVPLEPVPSGAVHFASSLTTLGGETTWLHPRLRLSGTLGYLVSGGTDGAARLAVPMQWGPRARVDARWALTRLDGLTTTATLTDARFSTGARATVVQLDETWAHRFSRETDGALGLGLGVTEVRDASAQDGQGGLLPGARLSLGHRFLSREAPLEARLTTRVSPFLDRIEGTVYPRAEATLLVTWTALPRLWVYGQGGAARALGGGAQGGDSMALGSVGSRWRLARDVNLEAELRGNWLNQHGLQVAERFQWAATVGLSVSRTGMF